MRRPFARAAGGRTGGWSDPDRRPAAAGRPIQWSRCV